jgi:GMP synthase-like glutamine amidotransferase
MAQTLRICMLNADVPVPVVYRDRASTYGKIFHRLLCNAANTTWSNLEIISTDFNVLESEYPANISEFDAIVISGSANSAYDDLDWIQTLAGFIRTVYETEPRIKIFGSCFGHQIMCFALLSKYDVRVEQDPCGWEVGVKEISLHQKFRGTFNKNARNERGMPEKIRLQFVHHDHVFIPQSSVLPPTWMTVGSTQHCAVQGVYEPGRILTLQGHFEFDRFVNGETIKFFFPTWEPQLMAETLEAVDAEDDSVAAAEMVVDFFMEGVKGSGGTRGAAFGLLTPPLQEQEPQS